MIHNIPGNNTFAVTSDNPNISIGATLEYNDSHYSVTSYPLPVNDNWEFFAMDRKEGHTVLFKVPAQREISLETMMLHSDFYYFNKKETKKKGRKPKTSTHVALPTIIEYKYILELKFPKLSDGTDSAIPPITANFRNNEFRQMIRFIKNFVDLAEPNQVNYVFSSLEPVLKGLLSFTYCPVGSRGHKITLVNTFHDLENNIKDHNIISDFSIYNFHNNSRMITDEEISKIFNFGYGIKEDEYLDECGVIKKKSTSDYARLVGTNGILVNEPSSNRVTFSIPIEEHKSLFTKLKEFFG